MRLDNKKSHTILDQIFDRCNVLTRKYKEVCSEMPIYEYQCEQCGQLEEALQKFSDKPLNKCKHCSGKLHKLISQSAFHLKGNGWYVTDYAGKSKKDKNTKSEPVAGKKSDKQEKASESESAKASTE